MERKQRRISQVTASQTRSPAEKKTTCHDKISERKTGKNDGADAVRDEGRT